MIILIDLRSKMQEIILYGQVDGLVTQHFLDHGVLALIPQLMDPQHLVLPIKPTHY